MRPRSSEVCKRLQPSHTNYHTLAAAVAARSYKFTHSRPEVAAQVIQIYTCPASGCSPCHRNLHIPGQTLQPSHTSLQTPGTVVAAPVIHNYIFPASLCSQVIQIYRLPVQWLQPGHTNLDTPGTSGCRDCSYVLQTAGWSQVMYWT